MKKIRWPGAGWKFSCMRCGVWYPSTEIKKEWTGLLVCPQCFETRHEQTLIKIRGEKAFPDIVNKDGTDIFVGVCNIATITAYADLATADCAQADKNSPPYSVVYDLFKNGHGGM
jgi:hypothetical protein